MEIILKCKDCYLPYNSTDRAKIFYPCGHSACKECFLKNAQSRNFSYCKIHQMPYPFDINNLHYDHDFLDQYN